jgi:hypothetical protein
MLLDVIPKLPMRNKILTKEFYVNQLGFKEVGDYGDYFLIKKEAIEVHFFKFVGLDPNENYGQVYIRVNDIDKLYEELLNKSVSIHKNGHLQVKSWGQKEFSLLDPDSNLLTFGQSI